jgi:hypothetical protein
MIDFSPMARAGFIEGLEAGAKIAELVPVDALAAALASRHVDQQLVDMIVKAVVEMIASAIRAAKAEQEKHLDLQMAPTDGRAN